MMELPLVFVAGILGVGHCVGMCGPMVIALGGTANGWSAALSRQLLYTLGRVFTYGALGAIAGFCGGNLAHRLPSFLNVSAILAIAAGILLIYQGGLATGLRKRHGVAGHEGCLSGGLLSAFLRRPQKGGVFLAGVFTGFLPCGLLYGMLALATATHSMLYGGATMMVFALGTAPGMILAGLGGRLLGLATRRRLYAAAAWCLVLTGVISVVRGVHAFNAEDSTEVCPCCER